MHKNRQSKLDEEMVNLGKERYKRKIRKAKELSIESTTPAGQRLLGKSIESLTDALELWLSNAANSPGRRHRAFLLMSGLPAKVIAGLTAKCVLDSISIERKITSTSITLGRLIEDEYKFRTIRDEEPALWRQMHRVLGKYKTGKSRSKFIRNTVRFHDLVLPTWDRKQAASVGLTCIELMHQSTGLISIKTRTDITGKSYTFIQPTEETLSWMRNFDEYNELLNPVWLPMVEKPVDWTNPYIGGYSSTNHRRRPLVKTTDGPYLEELAESDLTEVYSAINKIQSTKFRIDGPVFEVLKHCWKKGLPIGGLPSIEDEKIPNKPRNIGTDPESRRAWRKAAARIHFENDRQKSKRLQVMKCVQLADKFSNDVLRFPHSIDTRARGYPIPGFLHSQGPDYSSSLLSFEQGKVVGDTGVKWLYINTANKWGMDKEPYDGRIKWAEENMGLIRAIGKDPISNMDWAKADEPWKFLKSCIEVNSMHEVGSKYISRIPVSADACNQGLQIYSMLNRDVSSAESTNVIPTDTPSDVYQDVADIVCRKLYEDNIEYGNKWLKFGITRATTKRQTMTVVYSATYYSCRAYTAEWFYDELKKGKENLFGEETYNPCNYLAEKIWESIGEVVASARVVMDWLRECAGICLEHGVIPRWLTPLHFPVKMSYEKYDKYTVKTLVSGVLRQHRLRMPNGEPNRRKSLNSMAPNFVHSLDGFGGLLGETVNTAVGMGIKSIAATHDEYETVAEDMDKLHQAVRLSTVKLFTPNLLENFAEHLTLFLPTGVHLTPVPEHGTLDINEVMNSKYYFN